MSARTTGYAPFDRCRPVQLRPLILILLISVGCAERDIPPADQQRQPVLEMNQLAPGSLEIQILGPQGLRGLQARLTYDATVMRITAITAGPDATRLDRIFHTDLDRAQGELVVGLSDTRQVLLPARGSLFRITIASAGNDKIARVALEDPLGADIQGEAVHLEPSSVEVNL